MGQGSSSPITASTHAQAFSQTEYTRMVMDNLLNYMLKQLSVRDLLHISKESECKKYVLFKANAIYQYFYELRIFPTKDAKGLLTFRKIDDLVNPKGDQEKERQSLCLIVAYFYTRIFQIYGALALTLIDDMNAMTSSGIMTLPGADARLFTPGYYPQQTYHGKGGAGLLPEDGSVIKAPSISKDPDDALKAFKLILKNFKWIRDFLTPEYDPSIGFKTRYSGSSADKGYVYFKADAGLKDKEGRYITSYEVPPLQSYQHGKFYIGISSEWSTLEVYTLITPGEIKVKTNKLLFKNQYGETISVDKFEMTFYVEQKIVDGIPVYTIKDKSEKNVSQFLANYFSEIIIYLKDAVKQRKEFVEKTKTNSTTGRRSEEGITSHLRVEKMIDDLTVRKPLGHCIARALQLLKTEPFANEPGISQICSATFGDNKRTGIVKPGAPLSDSPGLFALANLFYDTIIIGSPNLAIGTNKIDGKSTFDEYVVFMNKLSEQYALEKKPAEYYKEKGLAGIIDKRDEVGCSTKEDIPISLETTAKVSAIVKSMFQQQAEHAGKCFKIISMLFNITYDKDTKKPSMIKLSDNVINKGFPELERINRAARELLVAYYTSCEDKYIKGMQLVVQEQRDKKKAEANAKAAIAKAQEEERAAAEALARAAAAKETEARIAAAKAKLEEAKAHVAQVQAQRNVTIAKLQQETAAERARRQAEADTRAKLRREAEERRVARERALAAATPNPAPVRTAEQQAELMKKRLELEQFAKQKAELEIKKKKPTVGQMPSIFLPFKKPTTAS